MKRRLQVGIGIWCTCVCEGGRLPLVLVGIGIWCTCVCEGGRLPLVLLPPLLPPPVKRGHKPVFNIIAGDSSATAARVRCLSPRLTSRNRTFQVPLNPIAVATAAGRQGDAPRSAAAARVRCLSPRLTSRNRTFQVPLNPIAVATAAGRQGDAPRSAEANVSKPHISSPSQPHRSSNGSGQARRCPPLSSSSPYQLPFQSRYPPNLPPSTTASLSRLPQRNAGVVHS
ncbi:hypothetical protein QE152_g19999 [Popillia japonica]|uniref:Uncharacterized protein n=1 Tax=Popillia japonica TaxID=7064 RepID=A0AAW1KQ03_POPJA